MTGAKCIEDASILYVEDDAITRKNFSHYLKSQCKILYTASDGQEGLDLYQKHEPDIVITDIEMLELNGLEMVKAIREISLSTQIIVITAYEKPQYLLDAVNLQLVQYLVKPISLDKITAVLALAGKFLNRKVEDTKNIIAENIYYDSYAKELIVDTKIVNLSKYERALLEFLLKKHPAPISYDFINGNIYDYGASKNAIKLLVSSLREKVEKKSIINVSGFGYKLILQGDK